MAGAHHRRLAGDGRLLAAVGDPADRPGSRRLLIATGLPGFAQLASRPRHSTDFDPARTVAFASLRHSCLTALAGPYTLHGLHGASADGGTWDVRRGMGHLLSACRGAGA